MIKNDISQSVSTRTLKIENREIFPSNRKKKILIFLKSSLLMRSFVSSSPIKRVKIYLPRFAPFNETRRLLKVSTKLVTRSRIARCRSCFPTNYRWTSVINKQQPLFSKQRTTAREQRSRNYFCIGFFRASPPFLVEKCAVNMFTFSRVSCPFSIRDQREETCLWTEQSLLMLADVWTWFKDHRRLYHSGSFNRSTRQGGEYVATIGIVGRSDRESKREIKNREKGARRIWQALDVSFDEFGLSREEAARDCGGRDRPDQMIDLKRRWEI